MTELQLFASFERDEELDRDDPEREAGALTPATMPTPATIAEAIYDATIRHECIRHGSFVEMLTHSATVNHVGGLETRGERV
ncbi:hypothetical protein D3261_04675 [Halococcus sp. IIIV-5B]|nr:hypothetical protein D3261_04675 [Halococcus sp. IIIV-5B]